MTLKDIQFLKDLQEQMQYEDKYDYDSQASPRFWVIADYRWVPTWSDNAEKSMVTIPTYGESYDIDELICNEREDGEISEEAIDAVSYIECEHTALEWINRYVDEDAYLVPVRHEKFIVPNTMFLTKKEAKEHIVSNHYHYTKEVHTYAMTAWRAPVTGKLINILNNIDWGMIT